MNRRAKALATLALLLAAADAAHAHAFLDHASPLVGSTVATAPRELLLWFTEKLEPAFSTVEVRNAQSVAMQSGKAQVDRTPATRTRVPPTRVPRATSPVPW